MPRLRTSAPSAPGTRKCIKTTTKNMTVRYVCPGSGGKGSVGSLGNLPTRPEDVDRLEAQGDIRQPPKRQIQAEEGAVGLPESVHTQPVLEAQHDTPDTMHYGSPVEAGPDTPDTMHYDSPEEVGSDEPEVPQLDFGKAMGTAGTIGGLLAGKIPGGAASPIEWGSEEAVEEEEAPSRSKRSQPKRRLSASDLMQIVEEERGRTKGKQSSSRGRVLESLRRDAGGGLLGGRSTRAPKTDAPAHRIRSRKEADRQRRKLMFDAPMASSKEMERQSKRGAGRSAFLQSGVENFMEGYAGKSNKRGSEWVVDEGKDPKIEPYRPPEKEDAKISSITTKEQAEGAQRQKEKLFRLTQLKGKVDQSGLTPRESRAMDRRVFNPSGEQARRERIQKESEQFGVGDAALLAFDVYMGYGLGKAGIKAIRSVVGGLSASTQRGLAAAIRGGSSKVHNFVKTNREAANALKQANLVSGVGMPGGTPRSAGRAEQLAGKLAGKGNFPKTVTQGTGKQSNFVGSARQGSDDVAAVADDVDPWTEVRWHRPGTRRVVTEFGSKVKPTGLEYKVPKRDLGAETLTAKDLAWLKANAKSGDTRGLSRWEALSEEIGLGVKATPKAKSDVGTKLQLRLKNAKPARTELKYDPPARNSLREARTGVETRLKTSKPPRRVSSSAKRALLARHLRGSQDAPSDDSLDSGLAHRFGFGDTAAGPPDEEDSGTWNRRNSGKKKKRKVPPPFDGDDGKPKDDEEEEKSKYRAPVEESDPHHVAHEDPIDRESDERPEESSREKATLFRQDHKPKTLDDLYSKVSRRQKQREVLAKRDVKKSMSYIKTIGDRVLDRKMALKAAMGRVPWWMEHHLLDYVRHKGFRHRRYNRGRK